MKIKKLRIRNFLALKDITLDFSEQGVFHLYGANNIGKSAIVSAISAVLRNVSNNQYKDFLRDDCVTFRIDLKTWEDNTITLSRGTTDYYEWDINGVSGRMDKTGGKVPKAVKDYVNLYVDEQKTKECLNIRLPRSLLTFVDMTGGDNAHLFQKALGTEEFLLSMKLSESKRREVVKEKTVLDKYREREVQKLREVEVVLSDERIKLERVEGYESVLKAEYGMYKKIEEVVESARDLQVASNKVKEAENKLKDIDTDRVKTALEELRIIEEVVRLDKGITEVEQQKDELEEVLQAIDTDELQESLEELRYIEGTLSELVKVTRTNRERKELGKKLEGIQEAGVGVLLDELRLIEELMELGESVERYKEDVTVAKETLELSDKNLGDFMRENRFCPIVARTLDKRCPFGDAGEVFG